MPVSPAIRIDRSKLPEKLHSEVHSDEDLDACPTECVREIRTPGELAFVLDYAERHGPSLVVVDFYKTACGSCKYIEKGFAKLCRAEGELGDPVIFLKHNVREHCRVLTNNWCRSGSEHLGNRWAGMGVGEL